jgi:iron complex outermembrane receptor protein
VYVEGDFLLLTNLHLNAGGRLDQYGDFDPRLDPRVALIYNPFEESAIKLLYGTAFRTPNFFELTANQRILPELKPERIATYEGIYEQKIANHLRSSISGFYNEIDDLIFFNSEAGHQRYENLEGAKAYGTEVALEATWAKLFRSRASYSYQHTENRATGEVLKDSPQHLGKFNLSAPLYKDKIFGAVELEYVSRRTTTFLTPAGTEETGSDAAGFATVNLTLFSQNLVKGLDISGSVYNLLDKRYSDPSTPFHQQDKIEQDGRTFRVKVTYRF